MLVSLLKKVIQQHLSTIHLSSFAKNISSSNSNTLDLSLKIKIINSKKKNK